MVDPAAFLVFQKTLTVFIYDIFAPDPFRGIYHANTFDLLLLIPYFFVLSVLAIYGMHRYYIVYAYYRHRRNLPAPQSRALTPLPRVTIQLPVYNERYVVKRLIEEV